jgi:hypothetical protein
LNNILVKWLIIPRRVTELVTQYYDKK